MAALPDLTARVRLDTTDLDAGVQRASALGSAVGSAFGNLAANGISAGITAIGGFLRGTIAAGRESEAIGKTTAAIIQSTGSAAGLTAEQVGELAERLSSVTGIDDEVIQGASNLLLTFKNVKNGVGEGADVFDRANLAALDLSKAGFGSVDGAAKMLGKALNDPLKGLTALGKAGVTFSDEQKAAIKKYVESGDLLAAQTTILTEVESQVGGVAEATATNADRLKVAVGNFQEDLAGKAIPAIDAFAGVLLDKAGPALDDVLAAIKPIGTALKDFADAIPTPVVKALGGALGILTAAFVVQTAATGALSIATGIASAAKGLFITTTNIETGATTRGTIARLAHNVATVAGTVVTVASTAARGVATAAQIAWTAATVIATGAATALRTAALLLNAAFLANPFVAVAALIALLVAGVVIAYKESETFRNIVNAAFQGIKVVTGEVVAFVIGIVKNLLTVWLAVAGGILEGATKAFSWVPGVGPKLEAANTAFKVYKDKAIGTLDTLQDSAKKIGDKTADNVRDGIKDGTPAAANAAKGMATAAGSNLRGLEGVGGEVGRNAGQGLVDGLNSYATRVAAAAQRLAIAAGEAMRGGLQEKSPSRVTRQIGVFAGQGLALGMDSTTRQVEAAAQRLAVAAVPDVRAGLDAAVSAGVGVPGVRGAVTAASPAAATSGPDAAAGSDLDPLLVEMRALRVDVRALNDRYLTLSRQGAIA